MVIWTTHPMNSNSKNAACIMCLELHFLHTAER